jgi:hypothetical protein
MAIVPFSTRPTLTRLSLLDHISKSAFAELAQRIVKGSQPPGRLHRGIPVLLSVMKRNMHLSSFQSGSKSHQLKIQRRNTSSNRVGRVGKLGDLSKVLLDASGGSESVEDGHGTRLVVGSGSTSSSERLLSDDGTGTL